jgi:hypothetical protein
MRWLLLLVLWLGAVQAIPAAEAEDAPTPKLQLDLQFIEAAPEDLIGVGFEGLARTLGHSMGDFSFDLVPTEEAKRADPALAAAYEAGTIRSLMRQTVIMPLAQETVYDLMVPAPFAVDEERVGGQPSPDAGQIGLRVTLAPTVDAKGRITLPLRIRSKSVDASYGRTKDVRRLQTTEVSTTLRFLPGMSILVGDIFDFDQREQMAGLAGLEAPVKRLFPEPREGTVLYLLLTFVPAEP